MRLLEPLTLRAGKVAPNRVLFGPHVTNLGRRRSLSDRHVAYYARRARGGVGTLVVEEAAVHPSDWPYERSPLAEACGAGWRSIAAACRAEAAGMGRQPPLVLAALGHTGGQGSSAYSQAALWAPSGVPEVNTREVPKVMEPPDIAAVVEGFAAAAELAAASGLDGVEVNAGQHSLIRQFLSGLTNLRDDDYGANRLRFAWEVLAAVRGALGDGPVLGLRLSCDELAPWAGITAEAAAAIAAELAPLCDYLVVVRGAIFSVAATRPDLHDPPGFNLDLAGAIRQAIGGQAVVFAQGSIVDAGQAEWAVAEGAKADGVEMTRAQIADPDLCAKLAEGRAADVRPCLLCNQRCLVRDNRNPLVSCVVEPDAGYEQEADAARRRAGAHLDVLVVGGGPAGLECARTAAEAGHAVTLVERDAELGGWARRAGRPGGRERLALIAAWQADQCERAGVRIETGRMVTFEDVERWPGPVVVCSGGQDRAADYPVAPGALVVAGSAVLENGVAAVAAEGPIVVWDPLGGPLGVAAAELLAGAGRQVTLVSPDFVVGTQLALTGDLAPANVRLHQAGVELVRRSELVEVVAGGAVIVDRFGGGRRTLGAATVVDCGHRVPDETAWPARALRAGDCVAPRTLYEAILEGRRAARELG